MTQTSGMPEAVSELSWSFLHFNFPLKILLTVWLWLHFRSLGRWSAHIQQTENQFQVCCHFTAFQRKFCLLYLLPVLLMLSLTWECATITSSWPWAVTWFFELTWSIQILKMVGCLHSLKTPNRSYLLSYSRAGDSQSSRWPDSKCFSRPNRPAFHLQHAIWRQLLFI
jgi:hypothetical protein